MKEKVINGVLLLIVIACVFGLLISWGDGQRRKAERKHIMETLDAKGVGDCTLKPVPGGWVYKIRD